MMDFTQDTYQNLLQMCIRDSLYYEPFGAIIPGLAHQEIRLLQQERVT